MEPRVVREGWIEARSAGMIVLSDAAGGELTLLGTAAALYDLADGTRSPAALAAALQADLEDIFAALDELADHGLLAARVAPPAGARPFTRREVLRTLAAAAATAVALPAGPAAAAPDKLPAPDAALPFAEQDEKALAARPPREHVYKEHAAKSEQHRKLKSVGWSEQEEKAAARLLSEQNIKAEADLLLAYDDATTRQDSADEANQKKLVEAPADLAALAESKRKAQAAPLRAEEEKAKLAARQAEQELKVGAQAEQTTKLAAREQQAKLRGEFGDDEEQNEKRVVTAAERRRKKLAVDEADERRARERRLKRQSADARDEEQSDKDVRRAQEQGLKAQREARRSDEQRAKFEAREAAVQQAQERREKLLAARDAQFSERRTERQAKLQEQQVKAKSDKQTEQKHKDAAVEQQQKDDAVTVELRAREHDAKSSVVAPSK